MTHATDETRPEQGGAADDLDATTLDQLRAFVAVVEEGSFSGAARRLHRVQSAVSHAIATLETNLGITLWDRVTRKAVLTDAGRALLPQARRVLDEAVALRSLATGLRGGLDPAVSICVDAFFPVEALADLCTEFSRRFPDVPLLLRTEAMGAVAQSVLDGTSQLGVAGPLAVSPDLERVAVSAVQLVPVVSPRHPLARERGAISARELRKHVQLVLGERGSATTPDQAVLSSRVWRVADLDTKRALIAAGLGWGNLPLHLVRKHARELVVIRPAAWRDDEHVLTLSLIHRPGLAMGPAMRWVKNSVPGLCARAGTSEVGAKQTRGFRGRPGTRS